MSHSATLQHAIG